MTFNRNATRINAVIGLLILLGLNSKLKADGTVGDEARLAVANLRKKKLGAKRINAIIAVMKLAGFNSRRLKADGKFGTELNKAFDDFLALGVTAAGATVATDSEDLSSKDGVVSAESDEGENNNAITATDSDTDVGNPPPTVEPGRTDAVSA